MGPLPGPRPVPETARTRPRLTPLRLLRYIWAAPATLVGLLAALVALSLGAKARSVRGVIEVSGGGLAAAVLRLPADRRFSAITFGHVVLGLAPDVLDRLRGHEHAHVRQYERWGLLFFPLYAASSVLAWLGHRDAYWHNHFECEARRVAALDAEHADSVHRDPDGRDVRPRA